MGISREDLNDNLDTALPPPLDPRIDHPVTATEYAEERGKIEDQDILQALREIDGAGGIRWKVIREGSPDPNANGHLGELDTESLTTDNLAITFGPGKYQIIGYRPNGTYAGARRVRIAADAIALKHRRELQTAANQPAGAFDVQRFMSEQEARDEARAEKRRRERMELLTIVGPLVAPIVAAMIGRQGPDLAGLVAALKGPTMPEMMTALASLKSLAPEQTGDPMDRALKLFETLKDLSGGGGEGGTNWADIVKEAVKNPALIGTLGQILTAPRATPGNVSVANGPLSLPAPAVAAPAGALPVPVSSVENPQMFGLLALLPWLKTQLAIALTKATEGRSAELFAERLVDDLPNTVNPEMLLEFVERPDWFSRLCQFEPGCAIHQAWFERMRAAVIAQFGPADGSPADRISGNPRMTVNVSPETAPAQPVEMPKAPPSLTGE